jgi:putative FmdB family regulatory protein
MPIFEYRCRDCQYVFEKIQRTPFDQETCPKCGGVAPRAVSAPSAGVSSSGPALSSPPAGCGTGGFS